MLRMKAREIAEFVGGELNGDGDIAIHSVAAISNAGSGQIAFAESNDIPESGASCLLISKKAECNAKSFIRVDEPKLSFARIAKHLHPAKQRTPETHKTAIIADDADIGEDVCIGAFTCVGKCSSIGSGTQILAGAKIGDNVKIGRDCVLHPNVLIEDGCTIGDRVILHAGVVIGADGFGFVRDAEGKYLQFPQIGDVVIENDVEIGANTCIDRGSLGTTRIGEGTKIDNLVQVGHNVDIGKDCVIAAQTGISGSVIIEDGCVIGGQVGFGDHSHVKSGAVIGSQAGVLPGKIVRPGIWWGTPIQPLEDFKRQNAMLKGIERLRNDVKTLRQKIDKKEEK